MTSALLEINDPYRVLSKPEFTQLAEQALKLLRRKGNYTVSLAIVSDKEIIDLNQKYRDKKEVTDVLSFSWLSEASADEFIAEQENQDLGEIVIAQAQAKKQAQAKGHSLSEELKMLYVHGLLHLLGYDHQSEEQSIKMEELAEKILNN